MKKKLFTACIIITFSICIAIASIFITNTLFNAIYSMEKTDSTDKKPDNKWKYMTIVINYEEDYDLSDIQKEGWQLIGIRVRDGRLYDIQTGGIGLLRTADYYFYPNTQQDKNAIHLTFRKVNK